MRARRRWRLTAMGGVLTSLSLASAWHGAQAAPAAASPTFGSYTITATAPGWEMWEDEPSANAHPEGGGQAPYSTAALTTGGLGYGLSSIAWPGATEANADKVALLLFPHDVQGVPIPDAITGLVAQNAGLANYPVRAEARSGTGKPDSSLDAQGATLKAHADEVLASATATMTGATGQAGFSFGNAETIANTVLNDTGGTSTADSKITKIDIGGTIKIDSVTSTATASTDGGSSSSSGSTVVQGMTIGGQPAYVDEQGVHFGEQGQPANAVVSQIANQALSSGGFSFHIAQPQQEASGATNSYTAGSLIIQWTPPGNPSENTFFIALGGSRVSVAATPGSAFASPTTVPFVPSSPVPAAVSSARPSGITSQAPTSGPPTSTNKASSSPAGRAIAATFNGLGGQAALGLLGAGLMFMGFRRVADDIVDRIPSTCPLENP